MRLKRLLFTGVMNNVFIAYEWLMMVSAIVICPGVARETKVLLVRFGSQNLTM